MSHALQSRPVKSSEITLINHQYLSCGNRPDSTIVWGTDVDAERLSGFVDRCNRRSGTLISVAHVLIAAVGRSLARHPHLNCRIVGSRIYRFRDVNVRIINFDRKRSDVDILSVTNADRSDVDQIAQCMWNSQLEIATSQNSDRLDKAILGWGPNWSRRWTSKLFWWLDRHLRLPRVGRIDRHLDSAVVVNYLGYADAPPMRMYKPSKFPDESSLLSVTLGRFEQRPVVYEGQLAVRRIAPLFVRADHRVTDAHRLSQFISSLRDALEDPQAAELQSNETEIAVRKAA